MSEQTAAPNQAAHDDKEELEADERILNILSLIDEFENEIRRTKNLAEEAEAFCADLRGKVARLDLQLDTLSDEEEEEEEEEEEIKAEARDEGERETIRTIAPVLLDLVHCVPDAELRKKLKNLSLELEKEDLPLDLDRLRISLL